MRPFQPEADDITPEALEFYVRLGHELRAATLRNALRNAFRAAPKFRRSEKINQHGCADDRDFVCGHI